MYSGFLSELILIVIAAFLGGFIARSLKLPPVLGYIVSGIIFGAIGKDFFDSYDSLLALSQIGISLFLFTLGFEISLDTLKKLNKRIFLIGILQILILSAIALPLLLMFGLELRFSILLSILFSFSSTAVIVKVLEEKGLISDFPGNNVFVFLLIQDILVVPLIFFLPVLFSETAISGVSVANFLFAAVKPLVIFSAVLLISRFLLSRLMNILFRYPSHELTILATIFTAALSILLFTSVGLPETIAAFLAGVLISEQGKNLTPLTELRPFRDLFLVLFFVLTGMLINIDFLIQNLPLIFGLSVTVVILKFLVSYILLRVFKYSPSSSVFISSYLANIGEFSVVIAQIAFVSVLIGKDEYNLILSTFILSLLFIPFVLRYVRSFAERVARLGLLKRVLPKETEIAFRIEQKFENHVIVCGHGRVGRETRSMLEFAHIPYVIVDFNRKVINELLTLSRYAIYGDPTDVDILKAAFIETAKALVIAVPDTFSQKRIIDAALKLNPKIIILCRSHMEEDRYDLVNMGVNIIIMPEMEAGLRIGSEVLDLFNIKKEDIDLLVKRLRRQHLL
ncbi:MAG: hypothetical protein A3C27_00830 [Candidatus Levybacteria bacterium RIFCSPHIGHO2_02_FULL_39_36]|nr:MAG: Sodium/hydrogen exchanger [Candidatus Levybacteria bacterium GW2011_GWA1_39_11]KKR25287.1 MAG: Sodium/hydrogen exchanger [Candidatus Levybacteria bacterium GW2011_GWB1_39_7]KKR49515.1 MAG: Sodium/hydrogen exchanger [Candidatus Levybacteria bacterium GW2011_GWA2_40_16]OGH15545.1 MAG: hypothetical protein A2689_00915 [Candidatus Levybacteria bacterium RIFCSPHIGHO2_01_FULL_38_96]OGH25341.1 MAG: hypothetical protein A3E68_01490 [Candidatus Levybacteria bacterium RIFCSPHIGHO2_12_FULL_39_39]